MFWWSSFVKELRTLIELQEKTLQTNRDILKVLRLRKPGVVFIKKISQEEDMLKFVLSLPTAGAADVVARKLSVKIGEADVALIDLPADALETAELSGAEGSPVVGSLIDVDDAGNESTPSEFSFVLTDTIAPPQPGSVGLRVTAEE